MKRFLRFALVASLFALPLHAEEPLEDIVSRWRAAPEVSYRASDVDPEALKFQLRAVVVFADSEADPRFQTQLRLLNEGLAPLASRDTIVVLDTDPIVRSALRQQLRPRGFSVLLLEKDGKITLRKPEPWTMREILIQIDKSPLRRDEISAALGRS